VSRAVRVNRALHEAVHVVSFTARVGYSGAVNRNPLDDGADTNVQWPGANARAAIRTVIAPSHRSLKSAPHDGGIMSSVSRGFQRRPAAQASKRLPPGQHATSHFPVLSAGATPPADLDAWTFTVQAEDGTALASWRWDEFRGLGATDVAVDIHCVTRWSKFDTEWRGVSVERILDAAGLAEPPAPFVMAFCDGGYTSNLPVEDLLDAKGFVVWEYDGGPLPAEHGGPARLLVPHLYFWKSAKWVRGLRFMDEDEPGFWEGYGYHNYGDPWREQRYAGD
jgi:DMSO/TMAO reductase YedYZ molybdopterin-dependent catalytic subunit